MTPLKQLSKAIQKGPKAVADLIEKASRKREEWLEAHPEFQRREVPTTQTSNLYKNKEKHMKFEEIGKKLDKKLDGAGKEAIESVEIFGKALVKFANDLKKSSSKKGSINSQKSSDKK